jgi:hypothetical protein
MSTKVQPNAMEINMSVSSSIEVRRCVTIMEKPTLLDKGSLIPDLDRFMWIQMKQNYDKHFERMENWKDISEKEKWVCKEFGFIILCQITCNHIYHLLKKESDVF